MCNKEKRIQWFLSHRYAYYMIFATLFSLLFAIDIVDIILSVDSFDWIEYIDTFLCMYGITYPLTFFLYEMMKKRIEKSQNKEK